MQLEIRQYEGFDVSFLLGGRNMKVNATEMAKAFGKRVDNFLANEDTKEFIETLKSPYFSGDLGIKSDADIYEAKGRNGTWMHRVLALKFSAWLNKKFEVWIYITVDELMFGQLPELAQKLMKAEDSFDDAQKILHDSDVWKSFKTADDHKKMVKKSIAKTQENQLNIFTRVENDTTK